MASAWGLQDLQGGDEENGGPRETRHLEATGSRYDHLNQMLMITEDGLTMGRATLLVRGVMKASLKKFKREGNKK